MIPSIGGGINGGAGGISPSSSSSATNGDFGATSGGVGGLTVNYGAQPAENISRNIVIGLVIIVGLLVWLKK